MGDTRFRKPQNILKEINTEKKEYAYFVIGYDSAVALALSNSEIDATRMKSKINSHLRKLGIEKIAFPDDSVQKVPDFINSLSGWISIDDKKFKCALQAGFAGLIEANTPGTIPNFNLRETAKCAGFPSKNMDDKAYLTWLYRQSGDELEYITE